MRTTLTVAAIGYGAFVGVFLAALVATAGRDQYRKTDAGWCLTHDELALARTGACIGRMMHDGCRVVPAYIKADQ